MRVPTPTNEPQRLAALKEYRILPICAWCKRVRDDRGYWSQVEAYIQAHSDAIITSSICPECMERERAAATTNR